MMARGRGARTYPLGELTAGELEALAYLMARAEDERVVPVRNQDRGLDVRLPDSRQFTLRGWQAKRFERGKIHWGQCRESVETAVAFWRPPRITFVFAHELSADEQTSFRTDLIERIALPVVLDFMPEAEIQRRLRDTPEGQQAAAWLFEDSEPELEAFRRSTAMGGELRDAAHAAERLAEIQRHLDRDPHLAYTTITADADAPQTPPAQGTAMSVITREGDQDVRFDAREKFAGALSQLGFEGAFVFTEDEAGRVARDKLLEAQRSGDGATIDSGIGIQMSKVPVGLRGLMTDEPVYGQVTLVPLPDSEDQPTAPQPSLVGILSVGGHELGMAFAPMDKPVPGWEVTLGGAAGGLEIFHSARGKPPEMEHKVDWRHVFGEGSALEQLLACRVLRTVLEGELVRLLEPGTREQLWLSAPLEEGDYSSDIEDLKAREQLLELVAELEEWTGQPIVVPAQIEEDDVDELSRAVGRIRSPTLQGTWDRLEVITDAALPADPGEAVLLEARHATIFGSELFLGVEQHHLPLVNAAPIDDGAELTPVEGHEQMTSVLRGPSEYPAEAARPPGHTSGNRVLWRKPESQEATSEEPHGG